MNTNNNGATNNNNNQPGQKQQKSAIIKIHLINKPSNEDKWKWLDVNKTMKLHIDIGRLVGRPLARSLFHRIFHRTAEALILIISYFLARSLFLIHFLSDSIPFFVVRSLSCVRAYSIFFFSLLLHSFFFRHSIALHQSYRIGCVYGIQIISHWLLAVTVCCCYCHCRRWLYFDKVSERVGYSVGRSVSCCLLRLFSLFLVKATWPEYTPYTTRTPCI